jgi:hypothetical protein
VQDAEIDRLVGSEFMRRQRDKRGSSANYRQPAEEATPVDRGRMCEREGNADQQEEGAGDYMRENSHWRVDGKSARNDAEISEIPTQVIKRHSNECGATNEIYRGDSHLGRRGVAHSGRRLDGFVSHRGSAPEPSRR